MRARARRRIIEVVAAAVALAGLVAVAPGPARSATPGPPSQVVAPVPPLSWSRCRDFFPRTLCATAEVPLDYDEPDGPTILLDLVKVPALLADERIGTLFVNPGGPGATARDFAFFAAELLGDNVALRYDVIGIDPRGVGAHAEMVCRKEGPRPFPAWEFPYTERESRGSWRAGRFITRACTEDPSAIVAHMSTADTARDLDLVRQAVGEEYLNYYGISYGSYLGAVYAALFPERVGRFVVDGVLDPVAWSTGGPEDADLPFSTRLKSARGSYEALTTAFAECDRLGRGLCPFAGNAAGKWRQLVRRARHGNLVYAGRELRYSVLVGFTLGSLYDPNYTILGIIWQEIYAENFTSACTSCRRGSTLTVPELRRRGQAVIDAPYSLAQVEEVREPFLGVACADSLNPTGRLAWWEAGRAQDRSFPWFGRLWTWVSAPCGGWPAVTQEDAYVGDFQTTPAHPILVVGNTYDPATPVQGARRFTTLFEGSRFLLLEGWGHGALGNGCVTAAYDAYYGTGALPPEGSTCQPDFPLFGENPFKRLDRWRPQHA